MMKRETPIEIAIIDMGMPDKTLLKKYGAYSAWFINSFRAADDRLDPDAFDVNEVEFADIADYDGLLLSGAEESAVDDHPWSARFEPVIRKYIDSGRPVLGVCFGCQYLGRLLGGRVAKMSDGGEFGNFEVALSDEGKADPLFAGIADPAAFLECHFDYVAEPAPGSTILASNDRVPVQAFRWGESVRGVQFHPEMTAGINMSIIDLMEFDDETKEKLKLEAQQPHNGLRLMRNFAALCEKQKYSG